MTKINPMEFENNDNKIRLIPIIEKNNLIGITLKFNIKG